MIEIGSVDQMTTSAKRELFKDLSIKDASIDHTTTSAKPELFLKDIRLICRKQLLILQLCLFF